METTQPHVRAAARPGGLRKALRWLGYLLAGLAALVALAAAGIYVASEVRLNAMYDTPAPAIVASTDPAVIMRGERLVHTLLVCTHCHGQNLAGGLVLDDPAVGRLYGPNLTTGRGGIADQRSDAELARAIRHGVRGDGRSMVVMPVEDYVALSEPDLTAVVSYIRSLRPVDNEPPPMQLGPVGRVLVGTGLAPVLSATQVDQAAPIPPSVPAGVTVEYGRYLARTAGCMGCHGANLSGGPIPGAPPSVAVPANITPGGQVGAWTDEDWFRLLREGRDPGGRQIDSTMPYEAYANMTDDEIRALITFLRTVPPREYGGR
jgi:mono/diheme cytochrome c family protein